MIKSTDSGARLSELHPLTGGVTLNTLFKLSRFWFSHLQNG